jgi:hypothetical protein
MIRAAWLTALALCPIVSVIAIAPGCGDACEDLQPICDRCTDATSRASCEQTVRDNVQDVCSGLDAIYQRDCPVPITTSSTASVGPTSNNASSVSAGGQAGAGGTGGGGAGGAAGSGGAGGSGGAAGSGGAGGN